MAQHTAILTVADQ